MTPVQSSNIAALGHDPVGLILTVEFKAGTRYQYRNVSAEVFNNVMQSESVGSAFHKLIKSQPEKYPFQKAA